MDAEIVELFVSGIHRYEGRPADGPRTGEHDLSPARVEFRAHLGAVGDRYFGNRAHTAASVTIQSIDRLESVAAELGVTTPTLRQTRRTVLVRGLDIDELRHRVISLDSGEGPVWFRVHRPANPCAWMNEAIAPGAHQALRGSGGMRCEPLTNGALAVGPVRVALSTG